MSCFILISGLISTSRVMSSRSPISDKYPVSSTDPLIQSIHSGYVPYLFIFIFGVRNTQVRLQVRARGPSFQGNSNGRVRSATPSSTLNDEDPFSFANWPMSYGTKDMMNAVKLTHNISPLPVFDINGGDPIVPSQYERFLKGAAVEIHFALTSCGKNAKAMNIPVIWDSM
ncbi:hypothetical protein JB92DRAFT_2844144 [Gautieria morchelliformis]|nr:hypothetical protein JB92DRAFT_2844144 [Gautieria morchelliformis]